MVIEIAAIFSPQTVTLQKGSNFYFRKDFWTRKTIEKTAEKKNLNTQLTPFVTIGIQKRGEGDVEVINIFSIQSS